MTKYSNSCCLKYSTHLCYFWIEFIASLPYQSPYLRSQYIDVKPTLLLKYPSLTTDRLPILWRNICPSWMYELLLAWNYMFMSCRLSGIVFSSCSMWIFTWFFFFYLCFYSSDKVKYSQLHSYKTVMIICQYPK